MATNEVRARLERAFQAHQGGDLAEAERHYRAVLKKAPEQFEALHFYGVLKGAQGHLAQAEKLIKSALKLDPRSAPALTNYGNVLRGLGRLEEAHEAYQQAIGATPRDALVWNNLGNVQRDLTRPSEAIRSYTRAIELNPGFLEAYDNLVHSELAAGNPQAAIDVCSRVLALFPDHLLAHTDLALALGKLERRQEAVERYRLAQRLAPDNALITADLVMAMGPVCDWSDIAEQTNRFLARCGHADSEVLPFIVLTASDDPQLQSDAARAYVNNRIGPPVAGPARRPGRAGGKLNIGYLSADFRLHPVGMLIVRLIELHDREAFVVHGFSAGPNDGSPMRRRLETAFDQFHDVQGSSDAALAALLRQHDIDILIDLNGHTENGRLAALRAHPVPVQVSYLGFPGTTGTSFIDYTLVDRAVVPADIAQHFSEQLVVLPDCFLPTDDKLEIAQSGATRADHGLPQDGFVFCAFHTSYKIKPDVFDVWMRLLAAVPGSVLWLSAGNAQVKQNLRNEASRRGVDPERLIFATRGGLHAEHLARQRHADLYLDVWPYNAHTTASEALWVGLPVLTCMGRSFAARVAGSLLRTIGLPELATRSPAEYEAMALRLAREPELLAGLRARLVANRSTSPLFDTDRLRRHIEAAFREMWARYQRGEAPASFEVPPIDPG